MKRKTIYDVAQEAGVSITTVSRAMNGTGYVSEDTRKRIEKAAENYRPVAVAREMKMQKSKTIGIGPCPLSHPPEQIPESSGK